MYATKPRNWRIEMSVHIAPEQVSYVHCNFCSTILAVSVPSSNSLNIVTVRCGHCANLLSVNLGALLQAFPPQDVQKLQSHNIGTRDCNMGCGSSSKCNKISMMNSMENVQQQTRPIHPPEKRRRVPSAYNRFIKEEIRRLKATNPDISHREAFSTAAKNWAHFPHIQFGLSVDRNEGYCQSKDPNIP